MSRTYLAHHELEKFFIIIVVTVIGIIISIFVLSIGIVIPEMVVMQVPGLARSSDLSRMR